MIGNALVKKVSIGTKLPTFEFKHPQKFANQLCRRRRHCRRPPLTQQPTAMFFTSDLINDDMVHLVGWSILYKFALGELLLLRSGSKHTNLAGSHHLHAL